jgi:hypothetical protein
MVRNLMSTPFDVTANWPLCSFEVRDKADEIVLEFPFDQRAAELTCDVPPRHRKARQ